MDPVAVLIAFGIFAAALLYSAVGHGGASGYLAILALAGFSIGEMRPTALCLNLLVASLAWFRFARTGAFSWRLLLPFAATSIPAAFFGGKIGLDSSLAFAFLGITLMLAAASLVRPWTGPARGSAPPPLAIALATGAGLGFLAGAVGVGGGIFLSPLLILCGWGFPGTVAGVSAAFILLNSAAGLAGNLAAGNPIPGPIWAWGGAALLGGFFGSRWGSSRQGGQRIRRLLALVLVVAAVKILVA